MQHLYLESLCKYLKIIVGFQMDFIVRSRWLRFELWALRCTKSLLAPRQSCDPRVAAALLGPLAIPTGACAVVAPFSAESALVRGAWTATCKQIMSAAVLT